MKANAVFPTDVGMNRSCEGKIAQAKSIPHGCGDEPGR